MVLKKTAEDFIWITGADTNRVKPPNQLLLRTIHGVGQYLNSSWGPFGNSS